MLNTLPQSMLGILLSDHSCSPMFLRLWLTGDKNLQARLEGGITSIHLTNAARHPVCYPQLIARLRNLRSMSLESNYSLVKGDEDYTQLITSLPRSLETLRLITGDPYSPLTDFQGMFAAKGSQPPPTRILDLKELFPSLKTLHIQFDSEILPSLEPVDFVNLPSSLTVLNGYLQLPPDPEVLARLPRSLRRLEGSLNFNACPSTETLVRWPFDLPNLEYVELLGPDVRERFVPFETFERGKTIRRRKMKPLTRAWAPPPALSGWPEFVNTVCIQMPFESFLMSLPRHITDLRIDSVLPPNFDVAELPRSLVRLHILKGDLMLMFPGIDDPDGENFDLFKDAWPPTLTELLFHSDTTIDSFLRLPDTLLSLSLDHVEHDFEDVIGSFSYSFYAAELPANLTRLALNFDLHSSYVIEIEGEMPYSLLSFELTDRKKRGFKLDVNGFAELPDTLTSLYCVTALHQEGITLDLPGHLQTITIPCWEPEVTGLPPGLTSLHVERLKLRRKDLLLPLDILFSALPAGMRHVTILSGNRCDSSERPSTQLAFLETFKIAGLGPIRSEVIKCFPPTLRRLEIELADLNPSNLALLSHNLVECDLGQLFANNHPIMTRFWLPCFGPRP